MIVLAAQTHPGGVGCSLRATGLRRAARTRLRRAAAPARPAEGDLRLRQLRFDNSAAALRLWNFLLTENERLHAARAKGEKIVGTMKDLGTVPVMAYRAAGLAGVLPGRRLVDALPDGVQRRAAGAGGRAGHRRLLLSGAGDAGRVRRTAALSAPDLLICSVGAVCDDFSAIAQRLEQPGLPRSSGGKCPAAGRRSPAKPACVLPGGSERAASPGRMRAGGTGARRPGVERTRRAAARHETSRRGYPAGQPGPASACGAAPGHPTARRSAAARRWKC